MKRILLLLLCMPIIYTYAQEEEKEVEYKSNSHSVSFMSREGISLKKEFYSLGQIGNTGFIELEVLLLTEILIPEKTGVIDNKIGCLRILNTAKLDRTPITYIGTLDYDELDACIKLLEYFKDNTLNKKQDTQTEYMYQTRDKVTVGFSYGYDRGRWNIFTQTKHYTSKSIQFANISNLDDMIAKFKTALDLIDNFMKGNPYHSLETEKKKRSKYDLN